MLNAFVFLSRKCSLYLLTFGFAFARPLWGRNHPVSAALQAAAILAGCWVLFIFGAAMAQNNSVVAAADSNKIHSPAAAAIVFKGDTLFCFSAPIGAFTPEERAQAIT